jgi:hypothetical protein
MSGGNCVAIWSYGRGEKGLNTVDRLFVSLVSGSQLFKFPARSGRVDLLEKTQFTCSACDGGGIPDCGLFENCV